MIKLKIKGQEKEVEVWKNGECDFCGKVKELFVGFRVQSHSVSVPEYEYKEIFIPKSTDRKYKVFSTKAYYKFTHGMIQWKRIQTGKYIDETKTFRAGICKDCATQLSKLNIE